MIDIFICILNLLVAQYTLQNAKIADSNIYLLYFVYTAGILLLCYLISNLTKQSPNLIWLWYRVSKHKNACCIYIKDVSYNMTHLFMFRFITKGQLISKCLLVVIVSTKIPTKKFHNFCPRNFKRGQIIR